MTDFSKQPMSIAEAKAHRSRLAEDWTPRDALMDMLRRIDSGELNPKDMVIAYRKVSPQGRFVHFLMAGCDSVTGAGMCFFVARMLTDPCEDCGRR